MLCRFVLFSCQTRADFVIRVSPTTGTHDSMRQRKTKTKARKTKGERREQSLRGFYWETKFQSQTPIIKSLIQFQFQIPILFTFSSLCLIDTPSPPLPLFSVLCSVLISLYCSSYFALNLPPPLLLPFSIITRSLFSPFVHLPFLQQLLCFPRIESDCLHSARMQSFKEMYFQPSFFPRGDENIVRNNSRFSDIGELENPIVFHQQDAVDLSTSVLYGLKSNQLPFTSSLHFGGMNANNYLGVSATAGVVEVGDFPAVKSAAGNGSLENWGDSAAMADTSQQTDTSTDVETDDRNQYRGVQNGAVVVDSMDQSKGKNDEQKLISPQALRRLAQNREAAKKSRLRKKAYVQQLENSRVKLAQLERELERARQQGFIASGLPSEPGHSLGTNGVVAFDVHYSRWLDNHQKLINDTRSAINSHVGDDELRALVESIMSHYDELFRLKAVGAKSDIFHILSGMWKTPAERCFMWLGGFRSSEFLKILVGQLEPLTEQQLMGICNLQQSCQQAEDALSQGTEALQQSLVETLSSSCLASSVSGVVADYMGQMAIAMGKLATLQNFVHQADLLRQQTLQQLHRILTARQAARALLVIHDYTTRLRALSSLWLARPKN